MQNCSVMYCVLKLCTVISTLRWAVLTVLWIGFCLAGPISLCIDSFVFIFVFFCLSCHTAYVLYYCNTVGWTWWDWSLILRTFLQCFNTVGWVIWPVKNCSRYSGTLNLTRPTKPQTHSYLLKRSNEKIDQQNNATEQEQRLTDGDNPPAWNTLELLVSSTVS